MHLALEPSRLERQLVELGGDITVALEEIRVPAGLVDAGGRIRWQNAASRRDVGDRTGEHVTSLFAPYAREQVESVLAKLLARAEPAEVRLPVREDDGSFVVREISAVPVRGNGTVVGIFGLRHPAGETTDAAPGQPSSLTRRQREVLRELAAGKSTQQIAAEMGISPTTVRNHVANLMAVLGVHTRLQAVIAGTRAGLVDSPSR